MMSSNQPKSNIEGEAALEKYRTGMKNLGRSLIILSVFQLVVGTAILAHRFELLILIILGVMATVHMVMGCLLLRNHGWANNLVAVWAALILTANFVWFGMQSEQQQQQAAASNGSGTGNLISMLIAGALLYYSIKNNSALRKVRAAGLEP
jgi:uncharacterized UBP type Zn finger protein